MKQNVRVNVKFWIKENRSIEDCEKVVLLNEYDLQIGYDLQRFTVRGRGSCIFTLTFYSLTGCSHSTLTMLVVVVEVVVGYCHQEF